jgi:3-oxoacyl-[acyl-carrier protein] reductase
LELGLRDRHVLITGASQGIGRATAEAFAKEGARVSILARREEKLREALDGLDGPRNKHTYLAVDLAPDGAPERACREVINRQGAVEIVIHNLGGTLGVRDTLSPSSEWQRVWRLNVGIAIDFNRILIPEMKEQKWGRAVHLISTAADDFAGAGPYSAAKAYLKAYVQILGRELAPNGVVVSGVSPGAVKTHDNVWTKKSVDQPALVADFLSKHQSIGRLGEGRELTPFILLLGSDLASFASASIVPVHGGCK